MSRLEYFDDRGRQVSRFVSGCYGFAEFTWWMACPMLLIMFVIEVMAGYL